MAQIEASKATSKTRKIYFIRLFGRIAVLKPYRGAHIGMSVIAALETAAKLKGGKKAILLAEGSAVGFYEKCGFKKSESRVVYSEACPCYWMEKNI